MMCCDVCLCSVIRIGSLRLVRQNSETSSQFEYRGEGNFFASSELFEDRCAGSEEGKDEDRYMERDMAMAGMMSSGECARCLRICQSTT